MFTHTRILQQLIADKRGPVFVDARGQRQRVHFRQGELDGACGQHCLCMAAVALGIFSRYRLLAGRTAVSGITALLWKAMKTHYFDGTTTAELIKVLDALAGLMRYERLRGAGNAVRKAIIDRLGKGQLVILQVESRGGGMNHWVLVVGVEVRSRQRRLVPTALLALDPDEAASAISVWNTRILLDGARRHGAYKPMVAGDSSTVAVRFHSAIAVWKANERRL